MAGACWAKSVENFIVQNVDAMGATQIHQRHVAIQRQDRARRIVREIDCHQLGVWSDRSLYAVNIQRPAIVWIQRHAGGLADREGQGFMALIVGGDDDGVAVGVKDHVVRRKDTFAGTGKTQNVRGGLTVIGGGNRGAQIGCPIGFGVAERHAVKLFAFLRCCHCQQIAHRNALGIGGGHVVSRFELPF